MHYTDTHTENDTVLDVVAANGTPFRVRYFRESIAEAFVEFYDQRYPHTIHGQFTGRYYVSTILGLDGYGIGTGGLDLYGGVPAWTVDAATMGTVRAWLTNEQREELHQLHSDQEALRRIFGTTKDNT